MDVFIVWKKDIDIYQSHQMLGVYKNKFDAIQYVREIGAEVGVDVQSEEDDSYIRKHFVDPDCKLVASYNINRQFFTVESTEVQ